MCLCVYNYICVFFSRIRTRIFIFICICTWVVEHTGICLYCHADTRVHGYMVMWVYCYVCCWLHSYMCTWVYEYMGVLVYVNISIYL